MGIGLKIKQYRERANLTQEELAELIGVTASAVGNYEREVSHPREDVLYKLFDALGAQPNELFSDCYTCQTPQKDILVLQDVPVSEHIEKYLALDFHGKRLVDACTQMEYERCIGAQSDCKESADEQCVKAAARGGSGVRLKKRKGAGSILDKPTYKGGSL